MVVAKLMLGEPIMIGRDQAGVPFALRDLCPHRGMPLSAGHFDGREIECCYHGWRFDTRGRCTLIPSLVPGQSFRPGHIRTRLYPAREVQGNIWVFFGEDPAGAPDIPVLDGFDGCAPDFVESVRFAAAIDHAVIGLMDPAHGPFVHRAWWWRSRRSIQQKAKAFTPSPFGFAMTRHAPSRNSRAYRLLGGAPETEIVFRLPSLRIERYSRRPPSSSQSDRDHPDRQPRDRDQPLHLLDPALARHVEARITALCAGISAPGPRHHGAPAARVAIRPAAHPDRRCRHAGKMVLPAKARIPPGPGRRPSVREPGAAAHLGVAKLRVRSNGRRSRAPLSFLFAPSPHQAQAEESRSDQRQASWLRDRGRHAQTRPAPCSSQG